MANNWVLSDRGPVRSFTAQVDGSVSNIPKTNDIAELTALMRRSVTFQDRILSAQNRQNELLEEVIEHLSAAGRQRAAELSQWKQANPRLARACKAAAEKLNQIQTDFIDSLSDEIDSNFEFLQDGDFILNEFVDKFGPRFVHLNTILQVLTQLGNAPDIVVPKKSAPNNDPK